MTVLVEVGIFIVGVVTIYVIIRIAKGQKRDQQNIAGDVVEAVNARAIQRAKPALTALAEVVTPDEYRARHYTPASTQNHLVVTVTNAGPGVATSVRI